MGDVASGAEDAAGAETDKGGGRQYDGDASQGGAGGSLVLSEGSGDHGQAKNRGGAGKGSGGGARSLARMDRRIDRRLVAVNDRVRIRLCSVWEN